jgi:hypothetical protein
MLKKYAMACKDIVCVLAALSSLFFTSMGGYQAVVVVPVVNAATEYQVDRARFDKEASIYFTLCNGKPWGLRSYQFLFNQVVEVVEERGAQAHITTPAVSYTLSSPLQGAPGDFWLDRSALMPLSEQLFEGTVPARERTACVLIQPWYDPATELHFSVGTCFVVDRYDGACFLVRYRDPETRHVRYSSIPATGALFHDTARSQGVKRRLFVGLIRQLIAHAQERGGVWRYVWGGSSAIEPDVEGFIIEQTDVCQVYKKAGAKQASLLTGFDCSGLIHRLAHMAGIDLPWRTTTVMKACMKPVVGVDQVKVGDIIWVPGHVAVITDVEKSLVAQARGYGSGYGQLYEAPLAEVLQGVPTLTDLFARRDAGKSVVWLTKQGTVWETSPAVEILSLI